MERKIGVVSGAVMAGALGPKEFGLLLTDLRSIFVLEMVNRAVVGAALGGVVGGLIASSLATRKDVDYERSDPSLLAGRRGSIVIDHAAIQRVRIKKKLLADQFGLTIEYAVEGKARKLRATLVRSSRNILPGGMSPKDVYRFLALSVQDSYRGILPPAVVARSNWLPELGI